MDFTHMVNLEWILAELEAIGRAIMEAEPTAPLDRLDDLIRMLDEGGVVPRYSLASGDRAQRIQAALTRKIPTRETTLRVTRSPLARHLREG